MQDELTLFRKMQEGDWNAFNSFFESYSERLYLYALGFVGNRAEAEDIVQDTFIYLWVNRAKISHSGSIYAYLSRSVKNSCIDRKLHEEVKQRYQREMMASGEEVSEDYESFEELYERLQIVMDSLPPKCKEIFILGCVEGLSYKDVAEQLGVSVNTVKTQVKVAYKKIKSEFGDRDKNFMLILCNSFFKEEVEKYEVRRETSISSGEPIDGHGERGGRTFVLFGWGLPHGAFSRGIPLDGVHACGNLRYCRVAGRRENFYSSGRSAGVRDVYRGRDCLRVSTSFSIHPFGNDCHRVFIGYFMYAFGHPR